MLLDLLRLEWVATATLKHLCVGCVEIYISNYSCGRIARKDDGLHDKNVTDR